MERNAVTTAEVIDLADVFRSIRNEWPIVIGCTLVGLIIAVGIILFVPPRFAGNASILLKTGSGGGNGSSLSSAIAAMTEGAAGGGGGVSLGDLKPGVETEVEILQSRELTGPIVDSLELQARITKPFATPASQVFSMVALPGSFKRRVYNFDPGAPGAGNRSYRFSADGDSGLATIGSPAKLAIGTVTLGPNSPARAFKVAFTDHEDATSYLLANLSFDKLKSDVAHFEYRADDSVSAAAVPNLLLSLYLSRRKGLDRGVNQRKAEFLALKVDSVGRALSSAERSLRVEREASGVIDPTAVGKLELENESHLRQQLTDIQVQEGAVQQLVSQVKSGSATPRQLAAYPQFLGGAINNLVSTLITVETQRLSLLTTRTSEDADVKALAAQQANIEAQLMPLAQQTLTSLASQRSSLEDRLKAIQTSLTGVPQQVESYGRLERDILDMGRIYAGLQTQLVDARLAAITEGGDVRPLDLAVPPKKPVFPKKSVTLVSGVGGGLFAGLILAVLIGIVGGRMHDAQDVERRTGLAAVRFEESAPLLVGGPASRTVLVAPINARASAKAVAERLVETALSRSMSATLLDLTTAQLFVRATVNGGGAHLIKSGSGNGNGNGFDANAAISRLEETHDLVIVELPELSSHAAAAVLSVTRPVLLVAPARRIERSSLQSAVDLLRRVGAPCAGVVLHGDDRRSLRA